MVWINISNGIENWKSKFFSYIVVGQKIKKIEYALLPRMQQVKSDKLLKVVFMNKGFTLFLILGIA